MSHGFIALRFTHSIVTGVKLTVPMPAETRCALIELETPGQPSDFRVTLQNFFVLTRYNRSNLYAAAVMDLATELVRAKAGLPALPPNPGGEDS